MAPKTSKKTQADLIAVVKAAGWKEDQKTAGDKHIRWWHPSRPEVYFTLRDAADLVRLRTAGVAKRELVKEARLIADHGFASEPFQKSKEIVNVLPRSPLECAAAGTGSLQLVAQRCLRLARLANRLPRP